MHPRKKEIIYSMATFFFKERIIQISNCNIFNEPLMPRRIRIDHNIYCYCGLWSPAKCIGRQAVIIFKLCTYSLLIKNNNIVPSTGASDSMQSHKNAVVYFNTYGVCQPFISATQNAWPLSLFYIHGQDRDKIGQIKLVFAIWS